MEKKYVFTKKRRNKSRLHSDLALAPPIDKEHVYQPKCRGYEITFSGLSHCHPIVCEKRRLLRSFVRFSLVTNSMVKLNMAPVLQLTICLNTNRILIKVEIHTCTCTRSSHCLALKNRNKGLLNIETNIKLLI